MITRLMMFLNCGSTAAKRTRIALWIGLGLICLLVVHLVLGASWTSLFVVVLLGLIVWACIVRRTELRATFTRWRQSRANRKAADLAPTQTLPPLTHEEPVVNDQLTIYTDPDSLSWLFMARHIWKLTASCLAYLVALIAVKVWAPIGESDWVTVLIVISIIILAPIYVYNFKREKFRKQETQVYVQGDDVVIKFPDSRLYGFKGGCPTLSIERIDTVSIDPRSFWRMFFFRNVRNMTIDSASDKDGAFNHLIDLRNAEEIRDAIRERKWAINHG
ncbi:MAG TPA: hypothetical protein VL362_01190 [Patescibacteria group bacterium]|nr:hypothetical protein [Patescibacteria group bacterium]